MCLHLLEDIIVRVFRALCQSWRIYILKNFSKVLSMQKCWIQNPNTPILYVLKVMINDV